MAETAGAVSLKVLAERKARGIQKSTQFQVDPRIIEIEEGFNARPIDPEHVQAMKMSMLAGTILPPLFVRVRPEDGGIIVVDGHHRLTAILALIDEGHEFKRVDCMQFRGNDADRIAHMLTSSQGKPLTPLQMGLQYRKLSTFGWHEGEIAAKVGKSRQHVHDMVLLAESNSDVQGMVARGEVAAHIVVAALRKHGSEAGKVLAGHLDTAKAAGKKKVTNKTIKKAASTAAPPVLNINEMVDRFLGWRLPPDFAPDCGIHFTPFHPNGTTRNEPVGTNLLTADQARSMIEYLLTDANA